MRYTETQNDSAVSPVIGVILMVAITVILAAVIGTFVLGLGENVDGTTSAGVSIEQNPGTAFTVTLVDTGNLDTAGIVGPDGQRSAFGSTDDVLAAGATTYVAANSQWSRNPNPVDNGSVVGMTGPAFLVAVQDAGAFAPTSTQAEIDDPTNSIEYAEECYIAHGANIVSGVGVAKAGIGCSGIPLAQYTTEFAEATGSSPTPTSTEIGATLPTEIEEIDSATGNEYSAVQSATDTTGTVPLIDDAAEASSLSTGSGIQYEAGAEFSFVGTVDGSENVVQSFTTADD